MDPCQLAWQDPKFGKLAIGPVYPSAPTSPGGDVGAETPFEVTIA
jgi:hypothetical protein